MILSYEADPKPAGAVSIRYDPLNPFVLCGTTLLPIYRGTPFVRCAFCMQAHSQQAKGSVCQTCGVAEIGAQTSGLRSLR